jgi:hypothetical protein
MNQGQTKRKLVFSFSSSSGIPWGVFFAAVIPIDVPARQSRDVFHISSALFSDHNGGLKFIDKKKVDNMNGIPMRLYAHKKIGSE